MEVKWWIGVVENKLDPERRGRIQVRILGVHPEAKYMKNEEAGYGVPTEDLPWALPCLPLTFGGVAQGTVPPPAVMPGAWVIGISLDGDAYSKLIVLSIISLNMSPLAINPNNMDAGLAEGVPLEEEPKDCVDKYYNKLKLVSSSADMAKSKPQMVAFALEYTKQKDPEKYQKFVSSSGVEVSDANSLATASQNPAFNDLMGKSYFSYCMDKCGNDPMLAALSYSAGYGKAVGGYNGGNSPSYLQKYGDPRKGEVTYAELANRIEEGGDKDSANVLRAFANSMGKEEMAGCEGAAIGSGTGIASPTFGSVVLPTVSNVVTSKFGPRKVAGGSTPHKGIDLRAAMNSPVFAMSDGVVKTANPRNYGEVVIEHDGGIVTRYLHNNKVNCEPMDIVSAGDTIAFAGGRGPKGATQYKPHLHFEVIKNGTNIDPEAYLNENGVTLTRKPGA